jgi:hypothetical protein
MFPVPAVKVVTLFEPLAAVEKVRPDPLVIRKVFG